MLSFIVSTPEDFVNATSYLSIDEAEAIIKAQRDGSQWLGLVNEEDRKVLLTQASKSCDGIYQYQGFPTDPAQFLKFPREGSKTIPIAVKLATALLAIRLSIQTGGSRSRQNNIKNEKLGRLAWTYDDSSSTSKTIPNQIEDEEVFTLLKPLRMTSVEVVYE